MPIHVLQLGPVPPPEGGVSRNMLAIRERLIEKGHTCTIIATSKSQAVEKAGFLFPRSAPALIQAIRSVDFDVLHLHVGGDLTPKVFALAATAVGLAGKKSVLTVHSGAFPSSREGQNAKAVSLRGSIFRQFGRLVAINNDLAATFERFGVTEERIAKILPFALSRPDSVVEIPADLAEFASGHSPFFLAVGGLEPEYEPILQIDAFREVRKQLPNAGLMIVGDGSLRESVDAASANVEGVKIAGNVPHEVTLHLMARADSMLRTTLFDGDAISIREAIFLGTPVIATDTGMRPEGVELMTVGDKERLVELMTAIQPRSNPKTALKPDNSNIDAVIELYEGLISAQP